MMKFQITSMTPEERLYAYSQSSQIEGQTGCIGYLRGDFGAGQEFYTSWFDRRKEYKDGEFKAEFDEVVNALREKDGLLCSRASMNRFCCQHPEAEFEGNYCTEYGFKVQKEGKPVGIDKEDPAYEDAKKAMKASQKEFAKTLASYADCYINDAFGTAHRKHASTAVIADYFDADNKMLGYLMEKEVQAVDNILKDIKRPFTAIKYGKQAVAQYRCPVL